MEDYKIAPDFNKPDENVPFLPPFHNSFAPICSILQKDEFQQQDYNFLEVCIKQFNSSLSQHPDTITPAALSDYAIPGVFFDIYNRFSIEEHRGCFLGALHSLELLSKEGLLTFDQMYESEIAQSFVLRLMNFENTGSNDLLTMCIHICSIIDNVILETDPQKAAQNFVSIGLSDALVEFVRCLSSISVDEASINYLRIVAKRLLSLRHHLTLYATDVEESISFIMTIIASNNQFLIKKSFRLVILMLERKMNVVPLFSDPQFVHNMCDFAFNQYSLPAIDSLCEYALYDEIEPSLHNNIIQLSNDIDYSSVLESVILSLKGETPKRKVAASLLVLVGNFFHKIGDIPDTFKPEQLQSIYEIIQENGSLEEKKCVSFLLLELWSHLPVEIIRVIVHEDDLNFVLEFAALMNNDLIKAALNFLKHFLEEQAAKFPNDLISYPCISSFLVDISENSSEEFAQKADFLISTYNIQS